MTRKKAINHFGKNLFVLLLLWAFVTACGIETQSTVTHYITWDSLEPDNWVSVWLIKRHIDPDAEIVLYPVGAPTDKGIAFGVPEAKYQRSHGVSLFESLRRGFHVQDPSVQEISRIIDDIELSPWAGKTSAHSAMVEQAFRHLQDSFEARVVPVDCYGHFFDEVYALVSEDSADSDWARLNQLPEIDPACRTDTETLARRDLTPFVLKLETSRVLDEIGKNRKVVFVDVREAAEYAAFHIPGAVNLQLRDVDREVTTERFKDADYVVPYCIKDFRGFEMARKLAELGVMNVGIMQPYGIAGWQHLGLPVASRGGLTDAEAIDKLEQCARAGTCLPNHSS